MKSPSFFAYILMLILFSQCQPQQHNCYAPTAAIEARMPNIAKGLARDEGMDYIGWGSRYMLDLEPNPAVKDMWTIHLMDHRKLNRDQARLVILSLYEKYLNRTLYDSGFNNDYIPCIERGNDIPLCPNKFGIKLAFWDENVNRPLCPNVAQVRVAMGEIKYYYVTNCTQKLGEPDVETLEEAYRLIREKDGGN